MQVGKSRSSSFKTDTVAPQGYCRSGREFIFYLAKALAEKPDEEQNMQTRQEKENCNEKRVRKDCDKPSQNKGIDHVEISMEYAYDITIATTDKKVIGHTGKIPPILQKKGLMINISRTEEYEVKNKSEYEWENANILAWVIGDLCIGLTVLSSSRLISLNSQQDIQEIYLSKLTMHCGCYFFVHCLRPKIFEKLHSNDLRCLPPCCIDFTQAL